MNPLQVGIVGAGMAAESHAFDIVTNDELELVAVCSRNAANAASFATRFGAKQAFTTVQGMLRSGRCGSVVVAVPPHAVLDVSRLVLEHGHPTLIEKPVATSGQALAVLTVLAETAAASTVVAYNRRYQQHIHTAVETVKAQALGPIYRVTACWPGPYGNRYSAGAPTYRSRARSRYGLITDTGIHILDLLVWIFGDALTVESCVLKRNVRGADVSGTMILGFDGHGQVHIAMSEHDSQLPERRRVRIEADRGTITFDEDGAILAPANGPARTIPAGGCRRPVDDLLALRDGRTALGASLRDAVSANQLLLAAYDLADVPAPKRWQRPRSKPWGRLNGSC